MIQKTVIKNLYEYNDIIQLENKELLEKILEKQYDINTDHAWYEYILENNVLELNNIGFIDAEIYFSGFHSQGDGACFDCKTFDIEKLLQHTTLTENEKKRIIKIKDYLIIEINKRGSWNLCSHLHTREFNIYNNYGDYKRIDKLINKIDNELENLRIKLCREVYNELNKLYDDLTSKEAILETLRINEYTFNENGCIEN